MPKMINKTFIVNIKCDQEFEKQFNCRLIREVLSEAANDIPPFTAKVTVRKMNKDHSLINAQQKGGIMGLGKHEGVKSMESQQFEALAWMYAQACSYADMGVDIREVEVPFIIESWRRDCAKAERVNDE